MAAVRMDGGQNYFKGSEIIMKKLCQAISAFVSGLLLCGLLTGAALAAEPTEASGFLDVLPASPCYEAVTYLATCGVTTGTGGQYYSPDAPLSIRQWAVMLCRAYGSGTALEYPFDELSSASIRQCWREGWLTETAILEPDSNVCLGALLQSGFLAAEIPVYNYELYPDGEWLSSYDNILRIGQELSLCGPDSTATDLMTRGDAALILFRLLTGTYEVEEPPLASAEFFRNDEGVASNAYLVELQKIPEPVLSAFADTGWTYSIDFEYLHEFSKRKGMACIGVASYSSKEIHVSEASATIHEFGHFLDWLLDFPPQHDALYEAEAQASASILRDYAATSSREYFADYFAYWVKNWENTEKMEELRSATPETYAYFEALEMNGWAPAEAA